MCDKSWVILKLLVPLWNKYQSEFWIKWENYFKTTKWVSFFSLHSSTFYFWRFVFFTILMAAEISFFEPELWFKFSYKLIIINHFIIFHSKADRLTWPLEKYKNFIKCHILILSPRKTLFQQTGAFWASSNFFVGRNFSSNSAKIW